MFAQRSILRTLATTTVLCLAIAGLTSTTAHARPPAPTGCTLRPNPHTPAPSEWTSCLSVSATLATPPAVGQVVSFTFDVTAEHAADAVTVEADLPGTLRWVTPPTGLTSTDRASANPQDHGRIARASGTRALPAGTVRYSGTVTATEPGPAEIRVRASRTVPGGTDAAQDTVFLTVGRPGERSVRDIRPAATGATTPITGVPVPAAAPRHTALPATPEPAGQAGGTALAATSCVTGGWFYVDHLGATRPSINTRVEAWDGGTLLASGFTAWPDGRYNLCFANAAAGRNVRVHFAMWNWVWRLRATGTNNDYVFDSAAAFVPDGGNREFGDLKPTDPTMMRGLHAFDEVDDAWGWHPGPCWSSNHSVNCRQLNINWSPTSTDGTYYSPQDNDVHLAAADPDAPMVVVHETAHAIMDETYNDAMPPEPNCAPHYIQIASSAGCAWVEGFAEWFPVNVYHDPYFRWPNGSSLNLENTSSFGAGDTVEGRVAGAMIDITDTGTEAPWDSYVEEPRGGPIWTTFTRHPVGTFAEFWNQRAADGFNVADNGALACLYQNAIDYGFRNPLADYSPLTRPTPAPHNYGYATTTRYWSAVAVRPPTAGGDYAIDLYGDRGQSTLLDTSTTANHTINFIAVDSDLRPRTSYYPRIRPTGTGPATTRSNSRRAATSCNPPPRRT